MVAGAPVPKFPWRKAHHIPRYGFGSSQYRKTVLVCACRGPDARVGSLNPAVMAGVYHSSLLPVAFRAFETQMTRLEAEFVRREAPPSYGQLIAQGLIPPVEDFPVYSASQVSLHEFEILQGPGFFPAGSESPQDQEAQGPARARVLGAGQVEEAQISLWSGRGLFPKDLAPTLAAPHP